MPHERPTRTDDHDRAAAGDATAHRASGRGEVDATDREAIEASARHVERLASHSEQAGDREGMRAHGEPGPGAGADDPR